MSVKTSQMTFNLLEGNNDLKIYIIVTTESKCTEQRKKPSILSCVYTTTYLLSIQHARSQDISKYFYAVNNKKLHFH